MDVDGLAKEWDSVEGLRDRLREKGKLYLHPDTQKWCEATRANAVANTLVLVPALERLRETEKMKLPYLEPLQAEISILFEKNGVTLTEKRIYTAAVETKKLLGFIKRRGKRQEVTKDAIAFAQTYAPTRR